MKCHCDEIEELRARCEYAENKALSTFDRLTEAVARAEVAEHKLAKIASMTQAVDDRAILPGMIFTAAIREVLDA